VWPGTGVLLSLAALHYAFNILKVELLFAEVFENNISPINLHKALGYTAKPDRLASTTGGKKVVLKCFEYKKQDWQVKREIILANLPEQIKQAAEFIEFN